MAEEREDDLLCSEVNTFAREVAADAACEAGHRLARFVYSLPAGLASRAGEPDETEEPDGDRRLECQEDSDGDLEVERRGRVAEEALLVEHRLHTALGGVGLQVWRGALLLADWLLHRHATLPGTSILEVGAGTGLAAMVAARCGAR
jgi:hypothetical protein